MSSSCGSWVRQSVVVVAAVGCTVFHDYLPFETEVGIGLTDTGLENADELDVERTRWRTSTRTI
jgi:hypothetical protein